MGPVMVRVSAPSSFCIMAMPRASIPSATTSASAWNPDHSPRIARLSRPLSLPSWVSSAFSALRASAPNASRSRASPPHALAESAISMIAPLKKSSRRNPWRPGAADRTSTPKTSRIFSARITASRVSVSIAALASSTDPDPARATFIIAPIWATAVSSVAQLRTEATIRVIWPITSRNCSSPASACIASVATFSRVSPGSVSIRAQTLPASAPPTPARCMMTASDSRSSRSMRTPPAAWAATTACMSSLAWTPRPAPIS